MFLGLCVLGISYNLHKDYSLLSIPELNSQPDELGELGELRELRE